MTYLIYFWSPWHRQWISWNMKPVSLDEAQLMVDQRREEDPTFTRRIVKV